MRLHVSRASSKRPQSNRFEQDQKITSFKERQANDLNPTNSDKIKILQVQHAKLFTSSRL